MGAPCAHRLLITQAQCRALQIKMIFEYVQMVFFPFGGDRRYLGRGRQGYRLYGYVFREDFR